MKVDRLGDFRAWTDFDTNGLELSGSRPLFMDKSSGDFRLHSDSKARGAGDVLPSDIAAALGLVAEQPVDLGMPQTSDN